MEIVTKKVITNAASPVVDEKADGATVVTTKIKTKAESPEMKETDWNIDPNAPGYSPASVAACEAHAAEAETEDAE